MTDPIDLGVWRRDVAGLSRADAAHRAGIPAAHAAAIEQRPTQATIGAVAAYVHALGGVLEMNVTMGGVKRLLVLAAVR